MSKLWQRSNESKSSDTSKKVEAFTVGNDYILDQELVPYDVQASKVHAAALKRAGILTDEEYRKLATSLDEIFENWKKGEFEILREHEDMHTAIEVFLTEKLGDLGKKIHTGRSRNDQVLTALRLFEKERLGTVLSELKKLTKVLLHFGLENEKIPIPGFTHTRKAMISSVGLWVGGFAELLILQAESSSGVLNLVDKSPLGTAAGFGTTLPVDREKESEELGFSAPLICSTTSQLSRGWIELQIVQFIAGITAVLNRLASDVIQYSSEAYRFFELDEEVCTGSSIMPQKKNPDLAELIRARHSLLTGYGSTLQAVTVNLGSGYHRDLQLTKEPVIMAFKHALETIEAGRILVQSIQINEQEVSAACTPEIFSAEAAYSLVKEKGISFRDAYQTIKENPKESTVFNSRDILEKFSHLGSPGNPGLDILSKRMDSL